MQTAIACLFMRGEVMIPAAVWDGTSSPEPAPGRTGTNS